MTKTIAQDQSYTLKNVVLICSPKTYVVGTHYKHLIEALVMSVTYFHGEIINLAKNG